MVEFVVNENGEALMVEIRTPWSIWVVGKVGAILKTVMLRDLGHC